MTLTRTFNAFLCVLFVAAVTAATLLHTTPPVQRDTASWGTRAPVATV